MTRTWMTGATLCLTLAVSGSGAWAETVADVPSARGGPSVRVLVEKPSGTPAGSVILLAGGHGNLNIGADGKLGWGAGNQVVRTRADYAKAGFVAVVPDIASDLKEGEGGKSRYRWSAEHAADIGAVIKYARTLAQPVHIVATSRGALSAGKAAATLKSGATRPDAVVITSGMLMAIDAQQPSVQKNVPGLGGIAQPVLLLYHAKDGCSYTPASSAERFKPLLTGSKRVDIKIIDGGSAGSSDPCQAQSHHGFLGQDADVVKLVTGWLQALPK
jgi:dienelactone hydrolase